MTVGALLFWIFIGLPIVGTVLWWVVMIVCAPFLAIGAGARTVKENRADKRAGLTARRDEQIDLFTRSFDEKKSA